MLPGAEEQRIFHVGGESKLSWDIGIAFRSQGIKSPIHYQGQLSGPVGFVRPISEHVQSDDTAYLAMNEVEGQLEGAVNEPGQSEQHIKLGRRNQLALSTMTNTTMKTAYTIQEYIRDWQFYSGFRINSDAIKHYTDIEHAPRLKEDAGNLGAVLHYLITEHSAAFNELQQFLRQTVPNFKELMVGQRDFRAEVMALWNEDGIDRSLTLADLSDGTLRLLCWGALCVHPNPPTLICLDEPDQGIHPRTLPILEGFLQKASQRTQILIATHSSYFLTQFDLSQIAVMRKEKGEAQFIKPSDSKTLTGILADFGPAEIEALHRSDELERLP